MNCIIVDDEPLAREGIRLLTDKMSDISVIGSFNNANSARDFMKDHQVDLIFLDIQMPGTNGLDFARSLSAKTLVIFTTAYMEFALDSYDVEAIDYLVKPVKADRFKKAVHKALAYGKLLNQVHSTINMDELTDEYFYVKADRKNLKLFYKDILFIEGLKDYVIIHTQDQKIITAMNIKTIHEQLPKNIFARVSKSYVVNIQHIISFDNNFLHVQKHEVPIGNAYRANFFDEFVTKKLLSR